MVGTKHPEKLDDSNGILVGFTKSFVMDNFSDKLRHKARLIVRSAENKTYNMWSDSYSSSQGEDELVRSSIDKLTEDLVDDAYNIIAGEETASDFVANGYGDVLMAAVIGAKDIRVHPSLIVVDDSSESDVGIEDRLRFYSNRRKEIYKDIKKAAIGNNAPLFVKIANELDSHLGIGAVAVLQRLIVVGGDHGGDVVSAFFSGLSNFNGDARSLVKLCVDSGVVGAIDSADVESIIEKYTKQVEYINKVCFIPKVKGKDSYIVPVGPPAYVFKEMGISEEHLSNALRHLIETGKVNTELFTRLCAGVDFSLLPGDLQSWFEGNGLITLPFDLVFKAAIEVDHCHEIEWGMKTELTRLGLKSDGVFVEQPTFRSEFISSQTGRRTEEVPDFPADIAIAEDRKWHTAHSYIIVNRFAVGRDRTGGILVPDREPRMAAVYVTARDAVKGAWGADVSRKISIGMRLPDIGGGYQKDLFSKYTDLMDASIKLK